MVPPHAVHDGGRVVILDDGPLHFPDLAELRQHLFTQHFRPEVIYVSEDQLRWIYDAMLADPTYGTGAHHDPLNMRWPGIVGYLYGVAIGRKQMLEYDQWRADRRYTRRNGYTLTAPQVQFVANQPYANPQPTVMYGTGTNTAFFDPKWFDNATLTAKMWGKKVEGMWLDEKKRPPPRTSHEAW